MCTAWENAFREEGGLTVELGMVGLGRMGSNMVERLVKGEHTVVATAGPRESASEQSGCELHPIR